jgi:hypothetical protein
VVARKERLIGLLAAALALASCRSLPSPDPGRPDGMQERYHPWPLGEREWIGAGFALLGRRDERVNLDDGPALLVDTGIDLARGPLIPSIELGFGWSFHDGDEAGISDPDPELSIGRVSFGARLTARPERWRVGVHARGGWFYRWNGTGSDEFDVEPFDQDGGGTYLGAGLDFWRTPHETWGPFFTVYRGDDGLEERAFGLGATIRR